MSSLSRKPTKLYALRAMKLFWNLSSTMLYALRARVNPYLIVSETHKALCPTGNEIILEFIFCNAVCPTGKGQSIPHCPGNSQSCMPYGQGSIHTSLSRKLTKQYALRAVINQYLVEVVAL